MFYHFAPFPSWCFATFAPFPSHTTCVLAQGLALMTVSHLQPEEDCYKLVLNRRDSETIASNYFRPRCTSEILHPDLTPTRGNPGLLLCFSHF